MPYKGDPIAEKLDQVAGVVGNVTGLTRLQNRLRSGRTFRFRFTPLVLLGLAIAGLWVQISVSNLWGYLVVMVAWMTASAIQAFSPIGNARGGKLDERETGLVKSGHLTGLLAAMGVAVLGCFLIGMGTVAAMVRLGNFWAPKIGTDWFALAFFLLAVEANIATMAASAQLPEDLDDEDE
ncbi:MAG: hypothetical protein J7493_15325 [Porphyrobacter sp.]|nr:hypothetical protein [Porphyrobacter sp.]